MHINNTCAYAENVNTQMTKNMTATKIAGKNATLSLQNLTESGAVRMINAATKVVKGMYKPVQMHSDLINILDDILKELGQLLYLFTLH